MNIGVVKGVKMCKFNAIKLGKIRRMTWRTSVVYLLSTFVTAGLFAFFLIYYYGDIRNTLLEAVKNWRIQNELIRDDGVLSEVLLIIGGISFCVGLLVYLMLPKRIIRDKKYIATLFRNRGADGPVLTERALLDGIYGTKAAKNIRNAGGDAILGETRKNVMRVGDFLDDKEGNNRILCLNGRWGSGKTSTLLMAIDKSRVRQNRYIYGAAFKYHGSADVFIRDVLGTLKDSMQASGIRTSNDIDALIENLDSNTKQTAINWLKNRKEFNIMSSDLILNLNLNYARSCSQNRFFVIIDDLDRMNGEDIVNIISMLSVLRNLEFVRIIVLADLGVIYSALGKCGVIDPPDFVGKYLPHARSIRTRIKYTEANRFLSDKILYAQVDLGERDSVRPAMAAIFIGMLSEKMFELTRGIDKPRYGWLDVKTELEDWTSLNLTDMNDCIKNVLNERLHKLLAAPRLMKKNCGEEYDWDASYDDIRKFQNIVYALRWRKDESSMPRSVKRLFSDEDCGVVENWVFKYMGLVWGVFEFNIRDILNVLEAIKYDDLPSGMAEQFVYVFNQLFPDEQLEEGWG